jgi:hypothetical protein
VAAIALDPVLHWIVGRRADEHPGAPSRWTTSAGWRRVAGRPAHAVAPLRLAKPGQWLEGDSQIISTDEGRPQNLRTRLGVTQIRDRQAGSDSLAGAGFGRQWLQDVLYGNRH